MTFEIVVKRGIVESTFRLAQFVVGFFTSGLAIKMIGETTLGTILIYQAEYAFLAAFFGVSMFNNAIIQFISETSKRPDRELNERIMNSSISVTFLFSLVFGGLALVSITPLSVNFHLATFGDNLLLVAATCFTMFFTSVAALLTSYVYASGVFITTSVFDGITGLVLPIANATVLVVTRSWAMYVLSLTILSLLRASSYFVLAKIKMGYRFRPMLDVGAIRQMPLISRGAYVASLASPLSSQADRIVLGSISGASALPAYSIAQTVLNGINSIIYGASSTFVPLLAREAEQANSTAARLQHIQRWFVSSFALFFYSAVILFLPVALSVLISADFGRRVTACVVLAGFQGLAMANLVIPIFGLTALKQMRKIAAVEWINSAGLFIFGFVLTLSFGAIGMPVSRMWYLAGAAIAAWVYCRVLGVTKSEVVAPIRSSLVFLPVAALGGAALKILLPEMAVWALVLVNGIVFVAVNCGALLWDLNSPGGFEKLLFLKRIFGYVRDSLFAPGR
jgi:O-antigen/teichoic acid export membrane protein